MNPETQRLVPGIEGMFLPLGYTVMVTDGDGQITVTVSKNGVDSVRSFPFPSINQQLSDPLVAWKMELEGTGVGG